MLRKSRTATPWSLPNFSLWMTLMALTPYASGTTLLAWTLFADSATKPYGAATSLPAVS